MPRPSDGPGLGEKILDRAYTPGRRELPALLDRLVRDEARRGAIETALLRAGPALGPPLLARLGDGDGDDPALLRLAGRLAAAGDEATFSALLRALGATAPAARRTAIRALGHLPPGDPRAATAERALLQAWERGQELPEQRALVEALGKVGGAPSRALFASLTVDDGELRRRLGEARLRLGRGAAAAGTLDLEATLPRPVMVRAHCRRGLEEWLADELADRRAKVVAPGVVELPFAGPLPSLFSARLWSAWGFLVAAGEGDLEARVIAALTSPAAQAIFTAFTQGPPRYRLELPGGKRRALTMAIAQAVAARRPGLVNDPSARQWEVVVAPEGAIELCPRLDDPRFPWRQADVPAASHPTVAAALARVAGVRPEDVVWDPFAGSAGELCERVRSGPWARLIASDLDAAALAVAGQNLAAAGAQAELIVGDALTLAPAGVTLILTNPPLGRRVHRAADLAPLLERFVLRAATLLAPGGRLVWLSPAGERTAAAADRAGLHVALRRPVDLGGFTVELQRFEKPRGTVRAAAAARRRPTTEP